MTLEDIQHYHRKIRNHECVQISEENLEDVAEWCQGMTADYDDENPVILVPTLGGNVIAFVGWWVIKEAEGSFYAMSHEVFQASYSLSQ